MNGALFNDIVEHSYVYGVKDASLDDILLAISLKTPDEFEKYTKGLSDVRLIDICVSYYVSRYIEYEYTFKYSIDYKLSKAIDILGLVDGEPFTCKSAFNYVKGVKYDDSILFSCFGRIFHVHNEYCLEDSIPVSYYNMCITEEMYNTLIENGFYTPLHCLWGYLRDVKVVESYVTDYVKHNYGKKYCNKSVVKSVFWSECDSSIYEIVKTDFKYVNRYLYIDGSIYRLGYDVHYVECVYMFPILGKGIYLINICDEYSETYLFVSSTEDITNRTGSYVISAKECNSLEAKKLLLL